MYQKRCVLNSIRPITFLCDRFRLSGTLHLPSANHPPVVIGSHGLLSDSSSPKQIALAKACNDHGIAFFRFDHRGCGKSQGDFDKETTFAGRCRDLRAAIETVKGIEWLGDGICLFGSSMGGAISLWMASRYPINALVTVAAPVRSKPVIDAFNEDPSLPKPEKLAAPAFDLSTNLLKLSNILIFHGDADELVPCRDAAEIYRKASWPKRLILFNKGDHRMSRPDHQARFLLETPIWFKSCLERSYHAR